MRSIKSHPGYCEEPARRLICCRMLGEQAGGQELTTEHGERSVVDNSAAFPQCVVSPLPSMQL